MTKLKLVLELNCHLKESPTFQYKLYTHTAATVIMIMLKKNLATPPLNPTMISETIPPNPCKETFSASEVANRSAMLRRLSSVHVCKVL